jgi:hypothetical protein
MRHQSRQQFRSLFQAKVSNSRNGSLIGYALDVSESGLKVISEAPFVTDEHLHMLVQVREGEISQFDLNAVCKWSGVDADTGYFEGGFCLDQPPATFASMVERLRNRRELNEEEVRFSA